MPALHEVLTRQLHFVCGKGGVGKSVVACALARAFHDSGKSVLLVQVNAADSHARLLETSAIGPELKEIERGFTVVNATPAAAMKEYALMTLRFEALYRTVFENRLTKAFLRFLPSLPELTIQGKIWHHAEERTPLGHPRYDHIVVDCPSTGHGLKFLRVARVIADASRVGPMAEKTRLMHAVTEDPNRTALHVVALPEELPVNEARDLVEQVRAQRIAPLGAVFLNQRLPRLFDDATERSLESVRAAAAGTTGDRALAQLLDVADRRRGRERLESEMRARLETLDMPLIELPMLLAAPPGPRDIERFASLVTDAAAPRGSDAAATSHGGR